MSDLILAAFLLSAPPGVPEPRPTAEHWPALRVALVQVAVEREIMDPRETFLLNSADEFDGDLTILRRRNQELADAPHLADVWRLPDRAEANERIRFNRLFRANLTARQGIEFDRAEEIGEVVLEVDRLYETWDAVRDARCEFLYVPARRLALKKLRGLIGPDAWDRGEMPPNVPVWRLRER